MCRRDEHASAGRDKGGAALPRPVACKPRQDARFCKLTSRPEKSATAASRIRSLRPPLATAAMEHGVAVLLHRASRDGGRAGDARVDRREVLLRGGEQLLEAVDDEVGFLVAVDAVARAHHALEIEADAVGRG